MRFCECNTPLCIKTKNSDGTYQCVINYDMYDSTTNNTYKSIIDYPRVLIKWIDNVEYGRIEDFEILSSEIRTQIKDNTLWTIKILQEPK